MNFFDYGFADLNKLDISVYKDEEQVLMNALNIYRVKKITKPQETLDGIGIVELEYGSIFDLYQKSRKQESKINKTVKLNSSQQNKYEQEENDVE